MYTNERWLTYAVVWCLSFRLESGLFTVGQSDLYRYLGLKWSKKIDKCQYYMATRTKFTVDPHVLIVLQL